MDWAKLRVTIFVVAGCGVMFIALTQMLPLFINAEPMAERLRKQIEQITGEKFILEGIRMDVLAGGTIIFDQVALKNPPEATANYLIRADRMEVHIGLIDALTGGDMKPESIHLVAPRIELEQFENGTNNWSFLYKGDESQSLISHVTMTMEEGEIVHTNHGTGEVRSFKSIAGKLDIISGQLTANLNGYYDSKPLGFSGVCRFARFANLGDYDTDCALTMKHETIDLNAQSRVIAKAGAITSKQTIKIDSADIRLWADLMLGQGKSPFSDFYKEALPLKLDAESYSDAARSIMNINAFESGDSKGKASVTQTIAADKTDTKASVWFEHFNYDKLATGFRESLGSENDPFAIKSGFDVKLTGSLNMQAKTLTFHGLALSDVSATAEMSGGTVLVSNATAQVGSGAQLITLGRITASQDGLEYDGLIESSGQALEALSPMFGVETQDVPKGVFGPYRARCNIIMRAKSTTLSELRLVTGNSMQIAGGINFYNEQIPRMDAAIAIRNIDFTPFEERWLKDTSLFTPPEKQTYNPYAFEWLVKVKQNLKVQLDMADYKLMGHEGKDSSITIMVKENQLQIGAMDMNLGGSRLKGQGKLELVAGKTRPQIEGRMDISQLRLGDFFLGSIWPEAGAPAQPGSVWSRKTINFYPLHYFEGQMDLRIRNITHDKFNAASLKGVFLLNDSQLSAKAASLSVFGGNMTADLKVDSAVVPGMEINYQLMNAQLKDIINTFMGYENINGLTSLSGRIIFTGLNFESWINNIAGHTTLDARNIFIQEFNLPAVIRSIESVRAVTGLLNSIRLSFEKGSTRIGNLNGTFYHNKGEMQITRITFRSNESVGELEGKINLMQWAMDLDAKFGLMTLAQTNYPYLVLGFTGPLDAAVLTLNTKMVEAFLAQKLR